LIEKCNGRCSWCIERNGYHPLYHAPTEEIASAAIRTGKTNIILLGGEPTLYKDLANLINILSSSDRRVWITTNGSLLSEKFVLDKLIGIWGVNISIHHYDLSRNKEITGIHLRQERLEKAISALHSSGSHVRMKVRFAELKQQDDEDDDGFVDLARVMDYEYGLNDDPFIFGCNSDCVISGIPVNFRQMCGLQTSRRVSPSDPEQCVKEVLYYDGKIYQGWQVVSKEERMEKEGILNKVTNNKLSDEEIRALSKLVDRLVERDSRKASTNKAVGGCSY
jgi:organic radical activating enzyme